MRKASPILAIAAGALLLAIAGAVFVRGQGGSANGTPQSVLITTQPAGGIGFNNAQNMNFNTFGNGFNYGPAVGLLVKNTGIGFFMPATTLTTTTTISGIFQHGDIGSLVSCYAEVESGAGTGTTPTLNVFVQDEADATSFNDRISFTQITTSASKQYASIGSGTAGKAPTAVGTGALAAGSIVDGPIGPDMRVQFVVGGTTPSFPNVVFGIYCHG